MAKLAKQRHLALTKFYTYNQEWILGETNENEWSRAPFVRVLHVRFALLC